MKHSNSRTSSLILFLYFALASLGCSATTMTTMMVSGRVVIEDNNQPLTNHEVELWILQLPSLPLGMGSYVRKASVRTDANGFFSLTAEVPKDRRFELRTRNIGTVLGGGGVNLEPASSISDVVIVHKR